MSADVKNGLAVTAAVVFVLGLLTAVPAVGFPIYKVWQKEQAGKAALAEAEQNRPTVRTTFAKRTAAAVSSDISDVIFGPEFCRVAMGMDRGRRTRTMASHLAATTERVAQELAVKLDINPDILLKAIHRRLNERVEVRAQWADPGYAQKMLEAMEAIHLETEESQRFFELWQVMADDPKAAFDFLAERAAIKGKEQ